MIVVPEGPNLLLVTARGDKKEVKVVPDGDVVIEEEDASD